MSAPHTAQGYVRMPDAEFEELLARAATEGARRALANAGLDAHQEVPHLHVHLFGGRPLGPMLAR